MGVKLHPSIFEKAADAIKERGHTKETYMDSDGCVCTLGAIGVALNLEFTEYEPDEVWGNATHGKRPEHSDEFLFYGTYLAEFLSEYEGQNGYLSVPEWNDDPATTPEAAEKFLRDAAQDLREEYAAWHKD
jgi:hypothetical protein